jgi:hypothetical protein
MGGEHYGNTAGDEVTHDSQQSSLVAQVQVGSGLVHEQDARLLSQGAGNGGKLAFAPAQVGQGPVPETSQTCRLQRFHSYLIVDLPRHRQRSQVGSTAQEDVL